MPPTTPHHHGEEARQQEEQGHPEAVYGEEELVVARVEVGFVVGYRPETGKERQRRMQSDSQQHRKPAQSIEVMASFST